LATVDRALRLIEQGHLDRADVTSLADRLGIGPRHLSRLFKQHLGATPTMVARTARVQRAKRLIDGSDLSMIEIAAHAGFSSLRSFNATFRDIYRMAPTDIRRAKSVAAKIRSASG
jgi:AraC family transcriptional regulator of adaptative response / DNA-3-methyladenine glycosylase II